MNKSFLFRIDWLSFFIYLILVSFGITNIYSTGFTDDTQSLMEWGSPAGKQFWIFLFSLLLLPFVLFINSNFFEHLSYVFYSLSILSLIGLFFFGQKISGATSWYLIGGFSLQPSEFAKITTALLISTKLSSIQMDFKKGRDLMKLFVMIGAPTALVILQPDAGSALSVSMGIILSSLSREGLDMRW